MVGDRFLFSNVQPEEKHSSIHEPQRTALTGEYRSRCTELQLKRGDLVVETTGQRDDPIVVSPICVGSPVDTALLEVDVFPLERLN